MKKSEIAELVEHVQKYIDADYRAFEDDEEPGIQLTVGYDPESDEWDYQTGDNSFTGAAYHYPIWGVCGVYRDSDSADVAEDLIDQIEEQIYS